MAEKSWNLSGQYMESCNCDYLCPCIYTNPQAPATHEHCYALMVYRIDRGRHGTVSLDGLKFALVIRSGRVMADGGWVFGVVVDASANESQRKALAEIVGGRAGGPPQMIRLLGGLLLLAAGVYQFTPAKLACLRSCRSPLDFVLNHWRD